MAVLSRGPALGSNRNLSVSQRFSDLHDCSNRVCAKFSRTSGQPAASQTAVSSHPPSASDRPKNNKKNDHNLSSNSCLELLIGIY